MTTARTKVLREKPESIITSNENKYIDLTCFLHSLLWLLSTPVRPDRSNGSAKTVQEESGSGQMPLNNEETAPPQRFVVTGAEARQCQLPSALLTRRRLIVGLALSVVQWKPMLCAVESQTTCGAAYDCEFRLAPSTTAGLPDAVCSKDHRRCIQDNRHCYASTLWSKACHSWHTAGSACLSFQLTVSQFDLQVFHSVGSQF